MIGAVKLWGKTIGAVTWDHQRGVASFQYDAGFSRSEIQVAPLTMPLDKRVYAFPELPNNTFHGMPGLLADCLPDKFGNALINSWLATRGTSLLHR
jgi:serine/threonine-protein kinase HipA